MYHHMKIKVNIVMLGGQNISNVHQDDKPIRNSLEEKKVLISHYYQQIVM